jgi:hypothetical protein
MSLKVLVFLSKPIINYINLHNKRSCLLMCILHLDWERLGNYWSNMRELYVL